MSICQICLQPIDLPNHAKAVLLLPVHKNCANTLQTQKIQNVQSIKSKQKGIILVAYQGTRR